MKITMIKKMICTAIIMIAAITLILPEVQALNTAAYLNVTREAEGTEGIKAVGGKILAIVQTAAIGIAVIILTSMGVQYIVASVDEKAQIKEKIIHFAVGAIFLFGGVNIIYFASKFIIKALGNLQ